MGTHKPTLLGAMTPFPYFIAAEASLDDAAAMMEAHGIHHLPVKRGEVLVGVISERDLFLAGVAGPHHGGAVEVATLCRGDALIVDVSRPLSATLRELAAAHHDAALVVRDGHLVGILTSTDAILLLARLLGAREEIEDEIA